MRFCVALLVLFLLSASHARASDGVLEINHTCAVNTGCFAGDTAGYPITITSPGTSYVLTSPLIVPDENTDGIVVSASSLTIDLNGFEIVRSGCEGATTNCTPVSGVGSGIELTSFQNHGITVKNGSVTGMGRYGVYLGYQGEVTGMRVRWNRLDGINTPINSIVSGNTAYQNGDEGIYAGAGSTVSGNSAYQNGDEGIYAAGGSIVSGNTAYQNGGNGIQSFTGSNVFRNIVRSNGAWGIVLSISGGAYSHNVISNNTSGTVFNGVDAGDNVCNGSLTCP